MPQLVTVLLMWTNSDEGDSYSQISTTSIDLSSDVAHDHSIDERQPMTKVKPRAILALIWYVFNINVEHAKVCTTIYEL